MGPQLIQISIDSQPAGDSSHKMEVGFNRIDLQISSNTATYLFLWRKCGFLPQLFHHRVNAAFVLLSLRYFFVRNLSPRGK